VVASISDYDFIKLLSVTIVYDLQVYTNSVEVVQNPDLAVMILEVVQDVVVFHVRAHVLLYALAV